MPTIPSSLVAISHPSNNTTSILQLPLPNSSLKLDSFALSGFFGGGRSVLGMATLKLIPGHRWCGWYNTPGSIEMAKQYGPLAHLWWLDMLFPEGERDPANLFKLDGPVDGPPFVVMHSGTSFAHTGHLAHLIMQKTEEMPVKSCFDGRAGTKPSVTIVNFPDEYTKPVYNPDLPPSSKAWFSLIPILVSIGACVLCALVADWFCFASIAVGIVANGLTCYVIGSGKLTFQHPKPTAKEPPGDGVLKEENSLVVLVGPESAVNAFTQGHFRLQYGEERNGVPKPPGGDATGSLFDKATPPIVQWFWKPPQHVIGYCALLLTVQFLFQLFFIPLGTLFGQLCFSATVVVSWLFNTCILSINRKEIQTEILRSVLEFEGRSMNMHKYQLSTRTASVAFICFVLSSVHPLDDPIEFLNAMIPNNTSACKVWKNKMNAVLKDGRLLRSNRNLVFELSRDLSGVDNKHMDLLETLLTDANDAWKAWLTVRDTNEMDRLRGTKDTA